jgi:hypothetical protein
LLVGQFNGVARDMKKFGRFAIFIPCFLLGAAIQFNAGNAATALGHKFAPVPVLYNGTYGTVFQENVNYARDDWSNNTDLNIAVGSSSSFNIAAYANPYGYPWEGNAVMYKYEYGQYKACSDYISTTYYGDCNGPVAVFAYVYLNTNYNTAASDNTKRGMIARHEMGHVWGLDHTSCVVTSLMRGYSCAWLAPPTKSDERVWVDANYP